MMSDLTYLKKELDRVEGRVIDFGSFAGCRVETVPRDYLAWCLCSVPLRPELLRSILRVLSRPVAPSSQPVSEADNQRPRERRREYILARSSVSSMGPGYGSE